MRPSAAKTGGVRRMIWVVLTCALAGIAAPAHAATEWTSSTRGLPVGTMLGSWTEADDELSAELAFGGGHVVGEGTTFRGTWTSAYVDSRRPQIQVAVEMRNINDLGERFWIDQKVRYQLKGRKWSPFFTFRDRMNIGSYQSGSGLAGLVFRPGRPVRFQWVLEGTVTAPTALDGTATLLVE